MNTPTRPPQHDPRGASRSGADEIEPVRAQALLLENREEFAEAARCWNSFLERQPEHAQAAHELGGLFLRMERFEDALRWSERALEIRPGLVAARINLGIALRRLNRSVEAVAALQEAVSATPDDAVACLNLGLALRALHRNDEALTWLRKASDLRPSHADSARELAEVLTALQRNDEAITAYQHAVSLQPDSVALHQGLGERLLEARRFEEAAGAFAKALDIDPQFCNGWVSLGGARIGLKHYADALAAFRRALVLDPGSVVAYCNMSLALVGLNRHKEAVESSRKALALEPGSAVASFNLGCALLALGNYREGWEGYEYRFIMGGKKWLRPEAHAEPWTGESLAGKSILVLGEQGNGDHIQFSRYTAALTELGAAVTYLAPTRLQRLLGTLPGPITLLSDIPADARFDFQCPLMSLAGRFDRLGLPIPATPYLKAEPDLVARWRKRIGDHGFRIGIVWQGNRYPNGDDNRSFQLAALRPLAALPGVRLIGLQFKEGREELDKLPKVMQVEQLGPDFDVGPDGFIDSAAVLELMDLVVSCDTSMVHVAGALGRPLWLGLTQIPEWRWQLQRRDTVWYPTARLFRQQTFGDWDQVFTQMADELAALLQARAERAANLASHPPAPAVTLSWGELFERMTLLEIKCRHMAGSPAAGAAAHELSALKSAVAGAVPFAAAIEAKRQALRTTHEKLWEVRQAMKGCAAELRFEAPYVEQARQAQALDEACDRIKLDIDGMLGSR